MNPQYRAGIIGFGQIGRTHAKGYRGVPGLELVAAAEPNQRVRQEAQTQFGIPRVYTEYTEMLEEENLDLVSICTWHRLHAEQTIRAAGYQPKAIICEKPMAIDLQSADAMIEACQKNGVKLVIGHQRRFMRSWTKARGLIAEGAIGKPVLVTAQGGEGLLNCGTHLVDGMRYLLGDPETDWVMAALERKSDRYEREVRAEDCCMALIQFKNGVQGLLQSDLTRHWSTDQFNLRGSDGMIEVAHSQVRLLNDKSDTWQVFNTPTEDPWIDQARETVSWVEARSGHRGDAFQARQTTEILMAIYESARNHEVVRIPLQEEAYPMDKMFEEGKIPVVEPGRYDIRAFLTFTPEQRQAYNQMRRQGMHHRDILAALSK